RVRRTRSTPLPLVGRGSGWGSAFEGIVAHRRATPLPTPPPQGGRGQTEYVDRAAARKRRERRYRQRGRQSRAPATSRIAPGSNRTARRPEPRRTPMSAPAPTSAAGSAGTARTPGTATAERARDSRDSSRRRSDARRRAGSAAPA